MVLRTGFGNCKKKTVKITNMNNLEPGKRVVIIDAADYMVFKALIHSLSVGVNNMGEGCKLMDQFGMQVYHKIMSSDKPAGEALKDLPDVTVDIDDNGSLFFKKVRKRSNK